MTFIVESYSITKISNVKQNKNTDQRAALHKVFASALHFDVHWPQGRVQSCFNMIYKLEYGSG